LFSRLISLLFLLCLQNYLRRDSFYLLAVHIVTSSPLEREVYSEHQSVVKALVGCGDVVVSADKSQALQNNPVAEAVGPSGCVYLIAKVLCLASHLCVRLSAQPHF
jgi:hypothetical protein